MIYDENEDREVYEFKHKVFQACLIGIIMFTALIKFGDIMFNGLR